MIPPLYGNIKAYLFPASMHVESLIILLFRFEESGGDEKGFTVGRGLPPLPLAISTGAVTLGFCEEELCVPGLCVTGLCVAGL